MDLYVLSVPDLVHGEPDADGITPLVEVDLAHGGVDILGAQGVDDGLVVGGVGLIDGVGQGQGRRVGVLIEEAPGSLPNSFLWASTAAPERGFWELSLGPEA